MGQGAPGSRKVAVLEFQDSAGLTEYEVRALSDDVREAALVLPRDRYLVMTRESMLVMLPPGTTLAQCTGAQCEVEMGRMVGADVVVAGEMGRFSGSLEVRLKVFDTRTAALLGTVTAGGRDLRELRDALGRQAKALMRQALGVRGSGGGGVGPVPGPEPRVEQVGEIRPEVGMLRVEGSPRGARVAVEGPKGFGKGGKAEGDLPWGPVEVPAGEYRVRVTAEGYDEGG
ncbi:hypothetical protein KBD49_13590, partial [Myxococcota bacterium]|nr:hypothetical protein [Myxococcota bacterium]